MQQTMKIETTEINQTDLMRVANISQAKAKTVLAKCNVTRTKGRTKFYRFGEVLQALLETKESQKERRDRISADIMAAKLSRMKAEQLDAAKVKFVVSEVLIQLRQIVRTANIDADAKHRLGAFLKHELENIITRLGECRFAEAEDNTNRKEENNDQDD